MSLFDLNMSRTIDAAPQDVFDAWIAPERFKIWMGCARLLMTPQVDGLFHVGVEHDGSPACSIYGRYLRLDRPRLIEHTWVSQGTHGLETLVSVSLEANGAGTLFTLCHTGLPTEEEMNNHRQGWTAIVGRLADHKARCKQ